MKLKTYLKNTVSMPGWYVTRQNFTDKELLLNIGTVIDNYNATTAKQSYKSFYNEEISNMVNFDFCTEAQKKTYNNYRNAIIGETLGLYIRTIPENYDTLKTSESYKYINHTLSKPLLFQYSWDRQIEKLCIHINPSQINTFKTHTPVFATIFLYKVLSKLYDKYKVASLSRQEYKLFVIRCFDYSKIDEVVDLIAEYRQYKSSNKVDAYIERYVNKLLKDKISKDVRLWALFGTLSHIANINNRLQLLKFDDYIYVKQVIEIFEKSKYKNTKKKDKLLEFLNSGKYFDNCDLRNYIPDIKYNKKTKWNLNINFDDAVSEKSDNLFESMKKSEILDLFKDSPETRKKILSPKYIKKTSKKKKDIAKALAKGECQLCHKNAPFCKIEKGKKIPYLEGHHIIPLSKNGSDSLENIIALCPNCHRKMHSLKLERDIRHLKQRSRILYNCVKGDFDTE